MSGVNRATILGRVGQDPELHHMQNNDAVCNLSIATSEKWKDKESGESKERTEWHRIVLYRGIAEVAGKYLRKGSQVYIEGKLKTRKWNKDGVDHYTTEIIGDKIELLGGRGIESEDIPQPSEQRLHGVMIDDDIPF